MRKDPDNDNLRNKVEKDIQDRQYWVDILKTRATGWSDDLRTYSLQAGDCEVAVQNLAIPFKGTALRDRLTKEDNPSDLQDDLDALERVPVR